MQNCKGGLAHLHFKAFYFSFVFLNNLYFEIKCSKYAPLSCFREERIKHFQLMNLSYTGSVHG